MKVAFYRKYICVAQSKITPLLCTIKAYNLLYNYVLFYDTYSKNRWTSHTEYEPHKKIHQESV
ncbi:hypothetical protein BDC45DRAFT_53509 [Circinella umbellata]|nr:hypothetical protein BDC45DRAFT_53509 [Circinella umbellata]